ncbi:MAG: Bax inhibitor-1/YccA family protein [Muribaculaceae bacterium]|nr:Bax inhibitor-1/YccA family protein [Muribaculaceae bacterium]
MDNYNYYPGTTGGNSVTSMVNSAMRQVYLKMTVGLLITAFISLFCSASREYMTFFVTNRWFMWVLIIAEFGLVLGIGAGIRKLSSTTATLLFYLFSVVNGLYLAPIFLVYSAASLTKTFFITAGTFGAMTIFGYTTKQDLSRFGAILNMVLIGLVIAIVVNLFAHSSTLDWIVSIVGVFVFIGLTAWDTQQIKTMAASFPADQVGRLATIGALNLYLDFINLFLFLLRFFGNSRD